MRTTQRSADNAQGLALNQKVVVIGQNNPPDARNFSVFEFFQQVINKPGSVLLALKVVFVLVGRRAYEKPALKVSEVRRFVEGIALPLSESKDGFLLFGSQTAVVIHDLFLKKVCW